MFSQQYPYVIKSQDHENDKNDHQSQNVMMFKQILPTCTVGNTLSPLGRICMLILGLAVALHDIEIGRKSAKSK